MLAIPHAFRGLSCNGREGGSGFLVAENIGRITCPSVDGSEPGLPDGPVALVPTVPLQSGFQIGKRRLPFPLDTQDSPSRPGAWFRLKRQKRGAAGTVYSFPHLLLGSCPLGFVSQGLCLVAVTPEAPWFGAKAPFHSFVFS